MGVDQSQQSQDQLDSQNSGAPPAWLNELNRLRETGGLKPVGENAELSRDCHAHAQYLIEQAPADAAQFKVYKDGLQVNPEDPQSKYFSAAGAECASGGKPMPGVRWGSGFSFGRDPVDDLDRLCYDDPFSRIGLLASWATVAGYGTYGDFPRRVGTLAQRGKFSGVGSPLIRFPTDGSMVSVGEVRNFIETPDPLAACAGYKLPVGLPITLQLGSGYRGTMISYSVLGPAGAVETCGFDWTSYRNPDPKVQERIRKLLVRDGASVLIPRHPLANGRYTVAVATGRQKFEWSFNVATQSSSVATK